MPKFRIGETVHTKTQAGLRECMITRVELILSAYFEKKVVKYRYGVFMDPDSVFKALGRGQQPRDYSVNVCTVDEDDLVKDVNDYIQCKLINLEARKAAVEMEIMQLKTELKSVGR